MLADFFFRIFKDIFIFATLKTTGISFPGLQNFELSFSEENLRCSLQLNPKLRWLLLKFANLNFNVHYTQVTPKFGVKGLEKSLTRLHSDLIADKLISMPFY